MANIIQIKRKTTTGAPLIGNLAVGEGVLNTVDSTLYYKKDAGTLLSWPAGAGAGDMLASMYDPTNVNGDAFDMDNMVEGTATKIFTSTERTKLTGIATGADVTDATSVNAAGATMNTDADVSANTWVLDEDTMSSNSATKVPTQQSVKAYTDAAISALVGGAPVLLDTLNELAAAIADDEAYAATVTTALGTKLDANSTIDGGEITV